MQRKTWTDGDLDDSDLDDGAKAWGSEWLHASCITMRRGLCFSVAAALISKSYIYIYIVSFQQLEYVNLTRSHLEWKNDTFKNVALRIFFCS